MRCLNSSTFYQTDICELSKKVYDIIKSRVMYHYGKDCLQIYNMTIRSRDAQTDINCCFTAKMMNTYMGNEISPVAITENYTVTQILEFFENRVHVIKLSQSFSTALFYIRP